MHRLDGASPQEITGAGCGLLARYIESAGSHRCQGIYIGAGEKKLCLPAVLFLEKSPKHPCPFSAHSEIVIILLVYPRCFSGCCFHVVVWKSCLLCSFFNGEDSFSYHPPAPLQPSVLIFKDPGDKPH